MVDIQSIFSIKDEVEFDKKALEVFHFQRDNCLVYKEYVRILNKPEPTCIEEIPFLPISFFRTRKIITPDKKTEIVFKSSGTTDSERSQHLVADIELYKTSFLKSYEQFIGKPEEHVILALLPNYLEQGDSSLVFMVDELIKKSDNSLSGFVLNSIKEVQKRYRAAIKANKKCVIIGVSYALLDLAETGSDFSQACVIETGGMKGRRRELIKEELHAILKQGLNLNFVMSEYGMTELLSQAYSQKEGLFQTPKWMKILIRDVYDPLTFEEEGKLGGVNIIDLANLYSCSFIATDDLGRKYADYFTISGRMDNSILRGCNLLV
jgi:phenylacetate-coenzyme A ligase PaaK-like adenylate-forming protein